MKNFKFNKTISIASIFFLALLICASVYIYANELDEEIVPYSVNFVTDGNSYVNSYLTQDLDGEFEEDVSIAYARNSTTGVIDISGDGQVNFAVYVDDGFEFDSVTITSGQSNYKNLKEILVNDEMNCHVFRLTKIKGDITVNVKTQLSLKNLTDDEIKAKIRNRANNVNPYYQAYYTEETAGALSVVIDKLDDLDSFGHFELVDLYYELDNAINSLVYKTQSIPQVYVTTAEGNGNTLIKDDGYTYSSIAVVDGTDVLESNAQFKVRGNTTSAAPKKPFAIKLDTKQKVLGMKSAKKWVLLANCFDPTMIRNSICFDFANHLGLEYTPDSRFVELYVDGVLKGMYLLTESVEVDKNRIDIDMDNGDFLLELEMLKTELGATYINSSSGLRFLIKGPEDPTPEQYEHIQSVLDDIDAAIASKDFDNVANIIDVDSFVKFYLVNEFARNNDFGSTSVNFYFKDGKMYAGPVWDFDRTFGYIEKSRYDSLSSFNFNYYPMLYEYSEFTDEVNRVLLENIDYLKSLYSEGGYVDTLIAQNADAIERNYSDAGWDVSYPYLESMSPLPTYQENIDALKQWMENRTKYLKLSLDINYVPQPLMLTSQAYDNGIMVTWRPVDGAESYKVYRSTDKVNWKYLANAKTETSYVDYTAQAQTLYYYKAVSTIGTNTCIRIGNGVSGYLEEKNITELKILSQPQSVELKLNTTARFSIEAQGDGLKYKWHYVMPNGSVVPMGQSTNSTFSKYITAGNEGLIVYCIVSDKYGNTVTSDQAVVTVIHDHVYTVTTVDPTCESGGYVLYECSYGESYIEPTSAALGHDYTYESISPVNMKAVCDDCHTVTVFKAVDLVQEWNNSNLNKKKQRQISSFDVVPDGIINAKDYAKLYHLSKHN